ncbi:MAG TPA: hypothetical protein VHV50_13100 [Actinomycetota bacterium]|jgi:hypothetical protein|nr:hypothetical protein [Actinomycetota bacterium]
MAELTNLEDKLGEVVGLAMAAQAATEKVMSLEEAEQYKDVLEQMNMEASEAERRGSALADKIEGKKTAILEKARETKSKGSDMLKTYIGEDSDALDGFEFLTMAEAGEVGHWKVLKTMAETAGRREIVDLVQWGLPIQERHFADAQQSCLRLAAEEDPNEIS